MHRVDAYHLIFKDDKNDDNLNACMKKIAEHWANAYWIAKMTQTAKLLVFRASRMIILNARARKNVRLAVHARITNAICPIRKLF